RTRFRPPIPILPTPQRAAHRRGWDTTTLTGKKKRIAGMDPMTMVRREPARGNHTVNGGMQEQVLTPGMQDTDDTDLSSQVFRIGCDFQQGLCAGGEQQIVKQTWVFPGEPIEFVGH